MNPQGRFASSILFAPLAAALLVIGAGCGGEDTPANPWPTTPAPTTPAPTDPQAYFAQEVYPRLATTCARCHASGANAGAPEYLGTDATSAYQAIKANARLYQPSGNSFLIKRGEHAGPALSLDQATAVTHWLDLEIPPSQAPVDPGDTDPALSDVDEALAEFAKCMDIGDWQDAEMHLFPFTQTRDSGPCAGCHYSGLGGTWLNTDLQANFEGNRQQPYILKLVEPEYDENGFAGLRQSDRLLKKGNAICPDLDRDDFDVCHPEFDFAFGDVNEDRLGRFVGTTLAKLDRDGKCR